MIPPEILQLIQVIGAPAVFVLLLSLRDWMQGRSGSKQENAITELALDSNAERKERQHVIDELQKSVNHLSAENLEIKLKQVEVTSNYAGRLDEVKQAIQRERDEMKTERIANDEKFRLMALDINELKKHREQSTQRISELEKQIAELERKLASANVEIDLLQTRKRELESELERERNRADTLNDLVTQIRAVETPVPNDKTVAIPDIVWNEDTETTVHIPPRQLAAEDGNPLPAPPLPDTETKPPNAA